MKKLIWSAFAFYLGVANVFGQISTDVVKSDSEKDKKQEISISNRTIKTSVEEKYKTNTITDLFRMINDTEKNSKERQELLAALVTKTPENKRETELLITALDDSDIEVQEKAIEIFKITKDKNAVPKLMEKLNNANKRFKELKSNPKQAKEKMSNPEYRSDYEVQFQVMDALSEMKEKKALPVMIDMLGNFIEGPYVPDNWKIIAFSIPKYGKDALPLVRKKIKEVESKNPLGKKLLASLIQNIKDKEIVPELKDMFEETNDPDIKLVIARSLRNFDEKIDISKIMKKLKEYEGNSKEMKKHDDDIINLIQTLGYCGNTDAIPYLKEKIESKRQIWKELGRVDNYNIPYFEMLSFASIGGQDNFVYLQNLYNETNDIVLKHTIISVFGSAKMSEAIPFLIEMLNNTNIDKQLRMDSAFSLEHITGEKEKYMKIQLNIFGGERLGEKK